MGGRCRYPSRRARPERVCLSVQRDGSCRQTYSRECSGASLSRRNDAGQCSIRLLTWAFRSSSSTNRDPKAVCLGGLRRSRRRFSRTSPSTVGSCQQPPTFSAALKLTSKDFACIDKPADDMVVVWRRLDVALGSDKLVVTGRSAVGWTSGILPTHSSTGKFNIAHSSSAKVGGRSYRTVVVRSPLYVIQNKRLHCSRSNGGRAV